MSLPRILINEDSPTDRQALLEEFARAHFDCEAAFVGHLSELEKQLQDFDPDVLITGFFLREYDGFTALERCRELRPEVPVIVLSSALSEETAVECMRRGAVDYVRKTRLPRIVPSVIQQLERRKSTLEKKQLIEEHEQVFQLTPNLFCVADGEGVLFEVNPAWTSVLGHEREQLLAKTLASFVHNEERTLFRAWWSRLRRNVKADAKGHYSSSLIHNEFECRMLRKDGVPRYLVWNAVPSTRRDRVFAYGHDVTEGKRIEGALRESEARFRAMADSAPVLMWVADGELQFTYFNRPWTDFTGRSLDKELRRGWLQGVHPDDLERCLEVLQAGNRNRQSCRTTIRLRRRDGIYRWILTTGMPRFDEQGRFLGHIGSGIDITEQTEAESALTLRAVKQTALVNFSSFALARHPFSTLLSGAVRIVADTLSVEFSQVLEANPEHTAFRLLASADLEMENETLGKSLPNPSPGSISSRVLLWPDDAAFFPGASQLQENGAKAGLAVVIGSSDKPFGLLTAATRTQRDLSGDSASFLQSIANILSTVHARTLAEEALEASEQKLLQSQKMEAVGLLAGGVAHDFNNLLTAVRCYAEILNDDLAEQAPATQPKVAEILKATARASALTRQLLAFSRKQVVQPEIIEINYVVNDISDIIRSLLSENISLEIQLYPQSIAIRADRGQMEQVLINLAINARDAMPQGGTLTLRTSRRQLTAEDVESFDLSPGSYVELAVIDTGIGMGPEIQAHLFEPFFTTKPKGRGTGLGLATCSVILKNSGGTIRCNSRLGEGTTFSVLLPEVLATESQQESFEDETPMGRSERILLVEDDEAVRTVTANILRSLGYEVHTEPGGAEALAYTLSDTAPRFDLLFTDIVMPYIGGHELAERLTALKPGLRVLFMSGYVDDPMILQAVQDSHMPFLEKPFNRNTLAKKLREALEGRY